MRFSGNVLILQPTHGDYTETRCIVDDDMHQQLVRSMCHIRIPLIKLSHS
jgi:hypothetical protein